MKVSVGCGGELRGTSGPNGWGMMKCSFHLSLFSFLLLHRCSQHPGCTFGLASHLVCVKEVLVREEGHWESLERMPGPMKRSWEHPGGCRQPGCVGTLILSMRFPLQSCRADCMHFNFERSLMCATHYNSWMEFWQNNQQTRSLFK